MSEQPSQTTPYERPPQLEHGDQLDLHMSRFEAYDAARIAEVRDAPTMREQSPEELTAMAVRQAREELGRLHIVRKKLMEQ